jgi:hypothetical protein
MSPTMASITRVILNSTIKILQMFLAGEFFHKIEAVFAVFKGVFMGYSDYGKSKCYGFGL